MRPMHVCRLRRWRLPNLPLTRGVVVTIDGLWYAMGCPRPRRLPHGVDARAIAEALVNVRVPLGVTIH